MNQTEKNTPSVLRFSAWWYFQSTIFPISIVDLNLTRLFCLMCSLIDINNIKRNPLTALWNSNYFKFSDCLKLAKYGLRKGIFFSRRQVYVYRLFPPSNLCVPTLKYFLGVKAQSNFFTQKMKFSTLFFYTDHFGSNSEFQVLFDKFARFEFERSRIWMYNILFIVWFEQNYGIVDR